MKLNYIVCCTLLFLIVVAPACDPGSKEPVNDYDYFPLKLNSPVIYQVTETVYSAGSSEPAVSTWQEKDEAIRRSESQDGFPVFVFARSRRNSGSDIWQKVKEYTVTRYPDEFLLSLDNATTVPMVFPVNNGVSWNLNRYNTRDEEECRYEYINQERAIGQLHFNKTLQVSGRNYTNDMIVRYNLGYSQYALGVGLIYDEQTDYAYCQEDHCIGQQQVISGTSIIRQLIEY